jgi:hypothetical protein
MHESLLPAGRCDRFHAGQRGRNHSVITGAVVVAETLAVVVEEVAAAARGSAP